MTSHTFNSWNDANPDLDVRWGQSECGRDLDAAVNTLRDIVALTEDTLPATTVAARVQQIARAALVRLGAPAPVEVEDCDRSGQCFPDGEAPF